MLENISPKILLQNKGYYVYLTNTLGSLYTTQRLSKLSLQIVNDIVSQKYHLNDDSVRRILEVFLDNQTFDIIAKNVMNYG